MFATIRGVGNRSFVHRCGPVRSGPLRSADRFRGAGSKAPGARSMCKTRQSGPVRTRGGATIFHHMPAPHRSGME